MNFRKIFLVTLFFLTLAFFVPKISLAAETSGILTSVDSTIVKIQEEIKYFFTFKIENKVQALDTYAEKRLVKAKDYAEEGNDSGVQNMIQSYLQIKERQNSLLGKIDGQVLGAVAENTLNQQKTMEEIKTKTGNEIKNEVIQVQEQVVNQVAERIVVVNGAEGQTEFFNKVEHVWAPGTGPGGTSGVIYEGGSRLIFAPGTSGGGGSATNDIKTVEVKTGGVIENGLPPGVTSGDGGTAVDGLAPGTTNSVESGINDDKTWTIDP